MRPADATNLAPGASVRFRKTLTVAEQAMFTGISGNLGGLYVDATKARALGATNMIAFELVIAGLATTCIARLGGPAHRIGRLDLRFVSAVPVGATIEAAAEVLVVDDTKARLRVTCVLDSGRTVVEGEAELVPFQQIGRAHV
jgi:3-hydroxybutyryl-CoA dehydratase